MEPAGTKSTRRAHRTNPVSQYGVLAGLRVKLENGLFGTIEGTDLWTLMHPLILQASDHAEDLPIHALFQQHLAERLHQRTNPVLGPIG